MHRFTKFWQNCSCGLGVKALFSFFTPKIVKRKFFGKKPYQIKSICPTTIKICQNPPQDRPHIQ
jgi:hypothetical protein